MSENKVQDGLHFMRLGSKEGVPVALFEFEPQSSSHVNAAFTKAVEDGVKSDDIRSKRLAKAAGVIVKSRNMVTMTLDQVKNRLKELEPIKEKLPRTIAALKKGMEKLTGHTPAPVEALRQQPKHRLDRSISGM